MEHDTVSDEIRDQAALYALGMLDPAEAREFERHLSGGCEVCEGEVRAMRETAADVAMAAAASPPPSLRRRLLEETQPLPPGVSATRATEGKWIPAPYPGVSTKPVYRHPTTGEITQLLRMEPGAKLPPHHHTADEQCLVLEGDIRMGNAVFRTGDFTLAAANSDHHVVWSEQGCLLLIVASPKDEFSPFPDAR